MSKKNKKLFVIFLTSIILIIILLPLISEARPGGGHSYSSRSSGGGYSDYGSGSGDLFGLIIWLLIDLLPPYISIPLIIFIFVGLSFYNKTQNQYESQTYVSASNRFLNLPKREELIENFKSIDPNFSRILFLDFVTLIFTRYYNFAGEAENLKLINPFFKNKFLLEKIKKFPYKIGEVVIGGISIEDIQYSKDLVRIIVEINANYSIKRGAITDRIVSSERWSFVRQKNQLSLEPSKMQNLSCPYCGAPANFSDSGKCEYCGNIIVPAQIQWAVENSVITYQNHLTTEFLLTYTEEIGTDYPTIYSHKLPQKIEEFSNLHQVDWNEYWLNFRQKIVKKYFSRIYESWSSLKWENARPIMTDRLWESFKFWIEAYKQAGLRNKLEDLEILNIDLVKIEIDKFYEAITVRIFAKVRDYVEDFSGKYLAGHKKTKRLFSEYWTFIRRKGVEKDDYDLRTCPNCGAPIDKIGQNGVCSYCGAKITTGEFSWVLALIIQDEEYKG